MHRQVSSSACLPISLHKLQADSRAPGPLPAASLWRKAGWVCWVHVKRAIYLRTYFVSVREGIIHNTRWGSIFHRFSRALNWIFTAVAWAVGAVTPCVGTLRSTLGYDKFGIDMCECSFKVIPSEMVPDPLLNQRRRQIYMHAIQWIKYFFGHLNLFSVREYIF